ncbi:hypothetical protein RvY_01874 [Ramazzottius varieornatus]|uniref:Uncharacterized protein n=1 Tax=Ramazzottius varieornatus TaxID=947166 RepID=A0A1D1UT08_RAMVA|nr:hypothetical protein RvY_01874 [Ramazzottius varieornatus]
MSNIDAMDRAERFSMTSSVSQNKADTAQVAEDDGTPHEQMTSFATAEPTSTRMTSLTTSVKTSTPSTITWLSMLY